MEDVKHGKINNLNPVSWRENKGMVIYGPWTTQKLHLLNLTAFYQFSSSQTFLFCFFLSFIKATFAIRPDVSLCGSLWHISAIHLPFGSGWSENPLTKNSPLWKNEQCWSLTLWHKNWKFKFFIIGDFPSWGIFSWGIFRPITLVLGIAKKRSSLSPFSYPLQRSSCRPSINMSIISPVIIKKAKSFSIKSSCVWEGTELCVSEDDNIEWKFLPCFVPAAHPRKFLSNLHWNKIRKKKTLSIQWIVERWLGMGSEEAREKIQ